MQWSLNIVTALRGAAELREPPENELESDSDDGLPWLVSSSMPEKSLLLISRSSESSEESSEESSSTTREPTVTPGEAKKDSE